MLNQAASIPQLLHKIGSSVPLVLLRGSDELFHLDRIPRGPRRDVFALLRAPVRRSNMRKELVPKHMVVTKCLHGASCCLRRREQLEQNVGVANDHVSKPLDPESYRRNLQHAELVCPIVFQFYVVITATSHLRLPESEAATLEHTIVGKLLEERNQMLLYSACDHSDHPFRRRLSIAATIRVHVEVLEQLPILAQHDTILTVYFASRHNC